MDLTRYKLRFGGKFLRFFSIDSRPHLRAPERLMAALLSRESTALESLALGEEQALHQFLDLVSENELTGFVLETIYLFKLEPKFRAVTIDHHGSSVDLMTLLTRQAGLEAIKFEKFEKKYCEFLQITHPIQSKIIWLKGIVTSRTAYSNPEYRLSGDFDCFIEPVHFRELFDLLYLHDFRVIAGDTGFCNQLGVGPVSEISDLFLTPTDEFVPSAVCGMYKRKWPILDVKVNPLDRGLRMVELERFKADCVTVAWRGTAFSAPDLLDQLLVTLTHFEKDRFKGWKQLLDIKVLAEEANKRPELWSEFIRRCKAEGVSTACAAGLSLAAERLSLRHVSHVIEELEPKSQSLLDRWLTFTVTPLFYWNTSSAAMLWLNAKFADDSSRKERALIKAFSPNEKFLSDYYAGSRPLNRFTYAIALMQHWIVMLLPGGLIRRTFGPAKWNYNQFGVDASSD